jgi:Tol biopolymer transport system component
VLDREASDTLDAMLRAARALPSAERDAWLEQACGSDQGLRDRLEELLRLADGATEWRPPTRIDVRTDLDSGVRESRPLESGQRLGRYEILGLLGAGGMGHVYLAVDHTLGREVAIKALAGAFHGNPVSLRRFEREARVLAALSHPNIAAIYGFERLDGAPYLILERIEGETLAQRLQGGPLTLRQALDVARQVAAGLEDAHAKGVVHRDLKPSNVMLAPGGKVKLVDFGLAKTAHTRDGAEVSAEPTTVVGAILGTVPYMSPEQIQGEDIDSRTDVWAFGCLLYEMLVGEPTFTGRSVPDLLAAVLRDEPRWDAIPTTVPQPVVRLVQRCLAKNPHERLQHLGDARLELAEVAADSAAISATRRLPAAALPTARPWLPWLVAAGAVAVAVALLVWRPPAEQRDARPLRLSLDLPAGLVLQTGWPPPFAIAPGGDPVAIVADENGTERIYLRALDDLVPRPLAGSERARQPFFSPDGRWVAFFADRRLAKVPVEGGAVVALLEVGNNSRGATWADDGTIVVAPSQTAGLVRLSADGGATTALTELDVAAGEVSHRWPDAVAGTEWVVFTVGYEDSTYDEGHLEAVSLTTGERHLLVAGAGFGKVVPGGPLLFVRGGRLHAATLDAKTFRVRGTPEALADTVRYDLRNGAAHLAVAASGVVVYGPGTPISLDLYLSWLDGAGNLERLVDTPRPYRDPRVSPDGNRAAIAIGSAGDSDLWLVDANKTLSRLSFGLAPHRPTWRPDGRGITVGTGVDDRWRLITVPVEGGGATTELLRSALRVYPNAWHPDGRRLLFQERHLETRWDLRVLEVGADGQTTVLPEPVAATPNDETNATLSPDGRWVAYESDEVDAVVEVYVRSFPTGQHKLKASSSGARGPVWGRDGELYFWDSSRQRVVRVDLRPRGEGLEVASETPLFGDPGAADTGVERLQIHTGWGRLDRHPTADRFLALETAAPTLVPALDQPVVIFDWAR